MRFVIACLSDRKHRECCFNNRGELVRIVETCIRPRKDRESSFHHWSFSEAGAGLFKCQETSRKLF